MATRAQKAKVGLFVVICVTLVIGGLLLMRGLHTDRRVPYWIEFDESILGLPINGVVAYMGMPVGAVSNMYVTDTNKAHVDMMIAEEKVQLKSGVTGQLVLYNLAAGTMCISLEGGEPGAPELAPGSMIPSRQSLVKNVSSQLEGVLDNIKSIMETVKSGLVGLKEGDLTLVIQDADGLIARGQEFLDQANQALGDVKEQAKAGLDDFHDLSKDVKKLVKDVNTAVVEVTKKVERLQVAKTEENLNQVMTDISDLAKRLQQTADSVDGISRKALHEADNVEFNLRETLRTLNDSLEAVHELMVYLQQDPSALIRGKGKPTGGK